MGGDWNAIRFPSERSGCSHYTSDMEDFSNWVDHHSLIDLQLNGGKFTWYSHQDTLTLSRLDRFLVSTDWLELYTGVHKFLLPKLASDHFPIILDSCCERWDMAPFRFEKMWLEEPHLRT